MIGYHNSKHRSIGTTPSLVTKDNENEIWRKLYGDVHPVITKYKYSVGDSVRISRAKSVLEKGYEANWTEEIFTIATQIPRDPVVYRIKDYKGEILEGVFYEEELQKVEAKAPGDTYIVEKILKRKKVGRNKLVLVKWRGYPSSMNSWIPESGLVTI